MKRSLAISSFVLVSAMLLAGGCSKSQENVSYDAIIHDLSPELQGSVERPVDINRNLNMVQDYNARMFWDDLGRALYTDQPSQLTPLPVGNFAANPQ